MLNKINSYQFDNLVSNRVPFLFFNMCESIASWYDHLGKLHIQTYEIVTTDADVMAEISNRFALKDSAIVLMCQNGSTSLKIQNDLQKMAYTNVYVIDGGYQQMMTERNQI